MSDNNKKVKILIEKLEKESGKKVVLNENFKIKELSNLTPKQFEKLAAKNSNRNDYTPKDMKDLHLRMFENPLMITLTSEDNRKYQDENEGHDFDMGDDFFTFVKYFSPFISNDIFNKLKKQIIDLKLSANVKKFPIGNDGNYSNMTPELLQQAKNVVNNLNKVVSKFTGMRAKMDNTGFTVDVFMPRSLYGFTAEDI